MVGILQLATTHQTLLMLVGAMIAAPGILVFVLMFPTDYQPSVLEARSPVGDGGVGYASAVVRAWGFWRVVKFALIPLLGVAIALFGALAPAMLVAI